MDSSNSLIGSQTKSHLEKQLQKIQEPLSDLKANRVNSWIGELRETDKSLKKFFFTSEHQTLCTLPGKKGLYYQPGIVYTIFFIVLHLQAT
ncbi:uncharacterized protein BP01DRAFT_354844 [Aspergillus saccharolyticus JOP 1030-1]|uniref:Uncharacterized protein n=1 Tax=Aspergillus saccharolyticus JOP 1030-1 TaxID=1450539 RepID=A0A318ZJF1_9EURO|nr:hypothetical protein BP01DRAFT_354844 [Aspergillus saccharolyticus JOP 1030-1]PYH47636.1 hypothetical protein BP01DRAFT_354844 [Aspergillus saccharolyticus JOP 1030-1]